jgi:bacteriorhodopsin
MGARRLSERRRTVLRSIVAPAHTAGLQPHLSCSRRPSTKEHIMGKYFIGWLLGVPVVVLVLAYLVFH